MSVREDRPPPEPGGRPSLDTFTVRYMWDAVWVSARVAEFAERCGMDRRAAVEVALVASELVTNAVKFATTGTVTLRELEVPRAGVEVTVEDRGPGIADPEAAMLDGYSEGAMRRPDDDPRGRRGLGSGLSAARRLSDELRFERPEGGGTRVIARRYRERR